MSAIAGLSLLGYIGVKIFKISPLKIAASNPCTGSSDRIECFSKHFDEVIKKQGAKEALAQLDDLQKNDQGVQSDCHPIIHAVGRSAFTRYGSVDEATKYGTEICWSGYYHGVMEAYMSGFDDKALLAKMPDICHDNGRPYSFDYYNCLHGLGHGVTIRFGDDIMKALPYCEQVHGDWEQQSCYSGAFMQNIVVDGTNHKSTNLRADDPVYPCNAVKEQMKQSCYLMVTSNVLKVNGYDYAAGFKTCDNVEAGYVTTCYQSMGRDISGAALLDPSRVIDNCNLGRADRRHDCLIGAVKNAVFNDRGVARATDLCQAVEARFKTTCEVARDEAAATL